MLSFKRHRFPPAIITSSIWLYARFTLSLRDVEEVFAERGLDVSYETVRRWVLKFGSTIAANLRRARPKPSDHWHLDELAVFIEASSVGSGVQSTTRVRSWTLWSSEDETPRSPRS
jgi:putative transposase